jgi:hypothetical protein
VTALSVGDAHLLTLDEPSSEFTVGDCKIRLPGSVLLKGCEVEAIPPVPFDDREELVKMDRPVPPKPVPKPAPPIIKHQPALTTKKTTLPAYQAAAVPPPSHSKTPATDETFDRLAQCESGGNWALNTGNGYTGGIQFSGPTWRGVGGSGEAYQHTRREQIDRGKILQARSGWRHNWPSCSRQLGLQD